MNANGMTVSRREWNPEIWGSWRSWSLGSAGTCCHATIPTPQSGKLQNHATAQILAVSPSAPGRIREGQAEGIWQSQEIHVLHNYIIIIWLMYRIMYWIDLNCIMSEMMQAVSERSFHETHLQRSIERWPQTCWDHMSAAAREWTEKTWHRCQALLSEYNIVHY